MLSKAHDLFEDASAEEKEEIAIKNLREGGDNARMAENFGILTFLLTDSTKHSLQVLSKTGEWIWADPVEGCYVCNIGDMRSEWTRGAYKSKFHRVLHSSDSLRISIPFFFDPNLGAFISPVLPDSEGNLRADEGIRYFEKFVRSVDYPLWRDLLAEPTKAP
ncbi:Clavaminate synthase-like protein [Amniculicola lignicola CBS 123094]|uniref:Clavaminate synthase-like protein n=1 Tax=Amniculicola lignicola CBS 123094 TaxID=1392246 RepID=A0A6A5VUU7_9PLEO|nr:Clavaminate synthase-like protein [Amniculicola lignicola CBS 123094]